VIPIVLVGLMGSGKSTVGKLVADATGRVLVDVDTSIKARTGKSVRELWDEGGESAYRNLERDEVFAALSGDDAVVIAAPGGVVLDPAVREAFADAFVVWLRASPESLAGRVRPRDHRPLLGDQPRAVFERMALERDALYASIADVTVDTDDLSTDAVATTIITHLPEQTRSE